MAKKKRTPRQEAELELLELEARNNLGRVSQPGLAQPPRDVAGKGFSILRSLAEGVPELAGGVVGGIATAGKPLLKKRVPGVALGFGAGEAVNQLLQQLEKLGGPDLPIIRGEEAPTTSLEAGGRIAGAAGAGAVSELATAGLGRLLKGLIPSKEFGKSVTREGAEAVRTLRPLGGLVTPAQATENRALDVLENVAEGSLFGGGRITVAKKSTQEIAEGLVDDFASSFKGGASKAELGSLVKIATGESKLAFDKASTGLYKAVDDLTGALNVDTIKMQAVVRELAKEEKAGLGSALRLLNKVADKGPKMSFQDAHRLRSDLLAVGRQTTELIPGKTAGAAKRLAGEIDGAMEAAAKTGSPQTLAAWREADSFFKGGKETFNSQIMKKIAGSDPDVVADEILKIRNPIAIKRIKGVINNDTIWRDVQGQYIDKVVGKATDVDGFVKGGRILQQLKTFGDDNLKAIFPKGEIESLRKFGRVLRTVEKGQPTGVGSVAIQLVQPGAAISFAAGKRRLTSLSILLGPLGIAKVFSNKKIVDFMLSGSKNLRTAQAITGFLTKLGSMLTEAKIEHDLKDDLPSDINTFLKSLQGVDVNNVPMGLPEPTTEPRIANQLRGLGGI